MLWVKAQQRRRRKGGGANGDASNDGLLCDSVTWKHRYSNSSPPLQRSGERKKKVSPLVWLEGTSRDPKHSAVVTMFSCSPISSNPCLRKICSSSPVIPHMQGTQEEVEEEEEKKEEEEDGE